MKRLLVLGTVLVLLAACQTRPLGGDTGFKIVGPPGPAGPAGPPGPPARSTPRISRLDVERSKLSSSRPARIASGDCHAEPNVLF